MTKSILWLKHGLLLTFLLAVITCQASSLSRTPDDQATSQLFVMAAESGQLTKAKNGKYQVSLETHKNFSW